MSHLLKRTKKSCIKLIRKISNKQIFLKRLEEEDISNDIDVSQEATEKDINQNENQSPENIVSCYKKQRKAENKATPEDASKDNNNKRKLSIHFEEVSADKAVLQSLTSKLFLTADGYEFRRLQQLRSDTASEIVPYDPQFNKYKETTLEPSSLSGGDKKLEVVFEKVKYKEDVRYLRHTPSTCSLDNYIINDEDDEGDFMMMSATTIERNTNNMNNLNAAKDIEYGTTTTNNTNNNNNNNTTTSRGLEMHNNHFASSTTTTNTALLQDHEQEFNPYPYTHTQQHQPQSQSQTQPQNHLLPVNVSLGCITDGNYHQLIIGEERNSFYKLTPVVKWDINGNSLEDDDFPEFSIDGNCSPTKSSLRSSSTTLETWLEVE